MKVESTSIVVLVAGLGLTGGCFQEQKSSPSPDADARDNAGRREQASTRDASVTSGSSPGTGAPVESSSDSPNGASSAESAQASDLDAAGANGARLFADHCAPCHGADARGTAAGPDLRPIAEELAEGDEEATVRRRLATGGRRMPAFPGLEQDQVDALIAHLAHLGQPDGGSAGAAQRESTQRESNASSSDRWRNGHRERGWRSGRRTRGCRMNRGWNRTRGWNDDHGRADRKRQGPRGCCRRWGR